MARISRRTAQDLVSNRAPTRSRMPGVWLARGVIFLVIAASCRGHRVLASDERDATGAIEGIVYAGGSGAQSPVAQATVRISGAVVRETQTKADGIYAFVALPPEIYTVEVMFAGLEAIKTITIEANHELQVSLQLKPPLVKTFVNVTASPTDAKDPAPTATITEKTIRDAPNVNERFETLLPLVPGVVRGPDGHINLKGASNTQSGALVNSANVTDPATGGPATNLPIDVVSSVQVISNPYNPEYGKLTGAVSSVSTKTSDDEDFHYSFQNFIPRLSDNRDGTISGLAAATPRLTLTFPIVRDGIAVTQSLEYRYLRTPVNSLPPFRRDNKLESFDSYTQFDLVLDPKQTATVPWHSIRRD